MLRVCSFIPRVCSRKLLWKSRLLNKLGVTVGFFNVINLCVTNLIE